MILKKEFKIIEGDIKYVEHTLNDLNEKGIINIISFNNVCSSKEFYSNPEYSVLVHVGPFKDINNGI